MIHILSPQLANQIAAGEVVERPASVIKELVENSIDAGSTQIDIELEHGGCKLIRVRDNGSGITKDELSLALARHATSKISTLDDLDAILSLGFRGEALASISSVSRLTLTSRTAEQSSAWQVYAEGRDMIPIVNPASHPVGSTVEVLDLFYNTPARRRFLKTEKTEFMHIDEFIKRISLARPQIAFNLQHNSKLIRQYRSSTQESRVAAVCGNAFMQKAVKLDWQHDDLKILGWITTGDSSEMQYFYVNGRVVKDKLLNHALRQAYAGRTHEQQNYVIFLELDPKQVDVNVHPTKQEVRFHEARLVHDFVYQAVLMALESDLTLVDAPNTIAPNRQAAGENIFNHPTVTYPHTGSLPKKPTSYARENKLYGELLNTNCETKQEQALPLTESSPVVITESKITASLFPKRQTPPLASSYNEILSDIQFGRVLTVVLPDLALLEKQNGNLQQFYIMSLSKAHQQMMAIKLLVTDSEPLLIPLTLLLDKREQKIVQQSQDLLTELGFLFEVEKFKIHLFGVPKLLRSVNWQKVLSEVIAFLATYFSEEDKLLAEYGLQKQRLASWLAANCDVINHNSWNVTNVISLLAELEQLDDTLLQKESFLYPIDLTSLIKASY
ncbi:DNA mismatch repair endonuclease MutL [Orbaceae bacterium ESL0721]|nr:DNA mismatch repair endonuclease MutL [Orbaceae bacterium ESL0721]